MKAKKTKTYNTVYGMRVLHKKMVNWKLKTISHHIEISMPGYKLTNNGPEIIATKKQELANDSK